MWQAVKLTLAPLQNGAHYVVSLFDSATGREIAQQAIAAGKTILLALQHDREYHCQVARAAADTVLIRLVPPRRGTTSRHAGHLVTYLGRQATRVVGAVMQDSLPVEAAPVDIPVTLPLESISYVAPAAIYPGPDSDDAAEPVSDVAHGCLDPGWSGEDSGVSEWPA